MKMFSVESIDNFLVRVRQAQRAKAKQITLSSDEAQEIAVTMAQIMLKQNELLTELAEARKALTIPTEVIITSGKFNDSKI